MNDNEDLVSRLESEAEELSARVDKLNTYLKSNDEETYKKLGISPLEQHLMSMQLMSMTTYMLALSDRIALIKTRRNTK